MSARGASWITPLPPSICPRPDAMDLLLTRRSGSAKAMTGPGPSADELRTILTAAARAPDHGKLFPWRFILFEGDARARFGEVLARMPAPSAEATPERQAMERGRFLRAPVVVGVVSRVREGIPIPVWEQELSAGAVCQTMLVAATCDGLRRELADGMVRVQRQDRRASRPQGRANASRASSISANPRNRWKSVSGRRSTRSRRGFEFSACPKTIRFLKNGLAWRLLRPYRKVTTASAHRNHRGGLHI